MKAGRGEVSPGVLAAIEERVRFARRRFGRYEMIDFVAVLFGYAASSEQSRHQASPGECAVASTRRRFGAPALERLEPAAASTGVHATVAPAMRRGTSRACPLCQPSRPAFAPFPC